MPDTYRVSYTEHAAEQLQRIFEYIEQDSPRNAARMIERILKAIESLEHLPHRFAFVRQVNVEGEAIRSMVIRPYLVRYHIDDSKLAVTILSVRHGARQAGF